MRSLITLFIVTALAPVAATAQANRVCVEEVGGVCLKYQDAPKPAPLSPAEAAERRLGLSGEERRAIQSGLSAEGFYDGSIDGALGPQSRRAIRAWQSARGESATGFLTGDQVAALKDASVAPAPEPTGDAPVAETETVEAPHPQPGRIYRAGHTTLQGTDIAVEVERISDGQAEITLKLTDGGSSLNDECVVEIEADVTCYMRRSGWNMIVLSGRLPRLVASETEAMPQVKIRADQEVFELW